MNFPFRLFVLFWFGTIGCFGQELQEAYEIDPRYPVHDLDPVLRVYVNSTGVHAPEDFLWDPPVDWKTADELPRFLESGSIYWGKTVISAKDSLKGWTLQFEDDRIGPPAWTKSNGKVDVYGYISDSLLFHKKTGVEVPKYQRDTDAHWVLNSIRLDEMPVDQPVTLILKVEGNALGYPAYFNVSARDPDHRYYHQIYQFNNSFNIFMFGVTLIIFLYHLLQFIYLREKVILWFVLWLLFCTLTQAMSIGLLIGSFSNLRFPLWMVIANGVLYTYWFFGRVFVQSRSRFPVLDKWILGLAIVPLAETLFMLGYVELFDVPMVLGQVGWHFQFLTVYTLFGLGTSIVLIAKKDPFARYFGIGSIIACLAFIVGTIWSMGIINMPLRLDPFATGIFLQILIYSIGIAYRRLTLAERAEEKRLEAIRTNAEIERIRDLDTLKTRFFTNISHEFRTPLTLIQGPLREATRNAAEEDNTVSIPRDTFQMVARNTKRLESLVDELLELSRIESGQIRISLQRGQLMTFIRSLASSFQSLAERENISFVPSFDNEDEQAWYDQAKLEKIVYNLLSNAFKFTPEGGSVHFSVGVREGRLEFEVEDTGKGVSDKDLPLIFERFYRVEGSEQKGSGIGLALCKELVELQQGSITVESTSGRGTRFRVVLPTRKSDFPPTASEIKDPPGIQGSSAGEPGEKAPPQNVAPDTSGHLPSILLVEDNEDLQAYISGILNPKYRVLKASDGLQGERMAIEHIPDIVVSDVMMPLKDGFELCHAIKANAKTSHIPVILLTAKAGQENKMEGLYQGADAYLTKPFQAEELHIRIKNLLESKHSLWEFFKASGLVYLEDIPLESLDEKFLRKVFVIIEDNLDDEGLTVEMLARGIGFSRAQLNRKLKALTDKSPNQLINDIRMGKAYQLLEKKTGSVSEVAYSVGYSNLSYFTKRFKAKFGCLPSEVGQD